MNSVYAITGDCFYLRASRAAAYRTQSRRVDRGQCRRRKPEDFPELAVDVFAGMDRGAELGPDEIKGRNTWNLWCGGDEQFWDRVAQDGFGLFDLLKTIDSRKRRGRLGSSVDQSAGF